MDKITRFSEDEISSTASCHFRGILTYNHIYIWYKRYIEIAN